MSDDVKPATDEEVASIDAAWRVNYAPDGAWGLMLHTKAVRILIARIRADAERIKALEAALRSVLYESDGCWHVGCHGDSDVTQQIEPALGKAAGFWRGGHK